MRKTIKKTLAVFLALVMLSGTFVCFAAELNQDAVNAHYGQYKKYLLLGDSAASGYRDEVTDIDYDYNKSQNHTTYYRVDGSYADIIADAIIEDKSMKALAAPGFRTIEMRYMLEDDFAATYKDDYLFHPSQLYVYDDEVCTCHNEKLLPGAEHFREDFKKSIAEADLISLGIGGNDWGAYVTWVVADILEAENVADQYIDAMSELLKGTLDLSTAEKAIEIAHLAGALPTLLQRLPQELNYGLQNFYENWDIMIQDIYDLNPDVTLMVVGMSDNSNKGKYYDYNGVEGEKVASSTPEDPTIAQAVSLVIDFIMGVGNGPMIEGAKKFGYTFVDINGTTYVDSHYDAAGHVFVANKIIEALPSKEVYGKYNDVMPGYKYYNEIEFCILNGILAPKSENEFGIEDNLTKGELTNAINAVNGKEDRSEDDGKANALSLALGVFGVAAKRGFVSFFKGITLTYKILTSKGFNIGASVTKAEAAYYFAQVCA